MTFCQKITVESENCVTGEGDGLQNILFGFLLHSHQCWKWFQSVLDITMCSIIIISFQTPFIIL